MSDQNKDIPKTDDGGDNKSSEPQPFDKQALKDKFMSNFTDDPKPEPKVEEPQDDKVDDPKNEDLDLDSDPEPNGEDDPIDEDSEPDNDLDKNIVALRKSHDDLKNKYDAQEETLNNTLKELEDAKQELENYTYTKIDPKSHPDFVKKSETTANSIHSRLIRLKNIPEAVNLSNQWGDILTDVDEYESTPRNEKVEALGDLRLSIAQRLGMIDSEAENLDPIVDGEAIDAADEVIGVFERHTSDYKELAGIYENIQTKAADKSLEIGYTEYQSQTETVRQSLAMIDSMSDKDIEEDPNSLQALAAKKIADSPELRAKSAKIDKYLIEMAFGPEALTQEELDRHQKAGKDMNEFHRSREKRVKEFREKRIPEIKALMLLLPQIKQVLPEFFDKESKSQKSKSQKQAIRQTTQVQPKKEVENKTELLTKDDLREKLRKNLLG